jgi:hypothetical protein
MRSSRKLETLESRLDALERRGPGESYRDEPVVFARDALGLTLDAWQARVLEGEHQQAILCCSRQAGKSTLAAVLGLHEAMYRPGSLTLLVSPSQRQSSELFRKVIDLRDSLPWRVPLAEDNRLSMRVKGGGRIVSLPGSERTIRGHSACTLLVEDEAARIEDVLHYSVMPMLATTRGRLLMMSTPWVRSGVFFETWEYAEGWHRERVTVHDVPRIAPEWVEEQRLAMPDLFYRCEYLCEFIDSEDAVFAAEHIDAAMSDDVQPLFGGGHA